MAADFLSGAREPAWRANLQIHLSALGESEGWGYDWPRHSNADFEFLNEESTLIPNFFVFRNHPAAFRPSLPVKWNIQ